MASASSAGVAFSSNSTDAPARSGNTSRPPSPNVNASGGVPVKISVGRGWTTCLENVSAMARTSRWKCMVALGLPVVPEVVASTATSSAAVSTSVNEALLPAHRAMRSDGPSSPKVTSGSSGAASVSSAAKR